MAHCWLQVRSTFYFVAGLLAWVVVRAVSKSDTTLFTGEGGWGWRRRAAWEVKGTVGAGAQ